MLPNKSLKLTWRPRFEKCLKCCEMNRQHTIRQVISNSIINARGSSKTLQRSLAPVRYATRSSNGVIPNEQKNEITPTTVYNAFNCQQRVVEISKVVQNEQALKEESSVVNRWQLFNKLTCCLTSRSSWRGDRGLKKVSSVVKWIDNIRFNKKSDFHKRSDRVKTSPRNLAPVR